MSEKIKIKVVSAFILVLLFLSCSKEEENNPVNFSTASGFILCQVGINNWSADEIQTGRFETTFFITGKKNSSSDPAYSSSQLEFSIINLYQPGLYGIGVNEPGYTYFVKSNYILVPSDGSPDIMYTAHYNDYSLMEIKSIADRYFEADFDMILFNETKTDSIFITGGRIKLDF